MEVVKVPIITVDHLASTTRNFFGTTICTNFVFSILVVVENVHELYSFLH